MGSRKAALLLVAAALAAPALAAHTVPKGTVVPVVLNAAVSSATSKAGDKVQLTLPTAQAGFPAGTIFQGELTNVVPKTDTAPGMVEGKVTMAHLPDGGDIALKAVPCTEKGEVLSVGKGKAPSEKKKTQAAKLGAIAAILVATSPEEANVEAGATAGRARVGKPRDFDAKPGKKVWIMLQEDVKLP